MPKGIKGFQNGHTHSEETKKKISQSNIKKIEFNCDMCNKLSYDKPSSYKRKKRHFCSMKCYSAFRTEKLPKEEQHRFGTGFSSEEQQKRKKCRSVTNKAIRKKELLRLSCEICGSLNSEAHHDNYNEPLNVKWLCFKHHREYHKKIYENQELLN